MPKVAIISDIHGNIDALEMVLADIEAQKVDQIYCLGDIVGYGACPEQCVNLVREHCSATVKGNHDAMTEQEGKIRAPERVAAGIRYARKLLSPDQLVWLRKLPLVVGAQGFTIVHASLAYPEEFAYLDTNQEARLHFRFQETHACFMGHTHIPVALFPGSGEPMWARLDEEVFNLNRHVRCAINVGSVGQPRDQDSRASYGVYDTEALQFVLRRVGYDIKRAQDRIIKAGLPSENAERLSSGM